MAKKKLNVFEFMSPEEIDTFIKAKLANHSSKGGKWANKAGALWDDKSINIRRSVIYELLGQGLSKIRVAEELMARWDISEATAFTYIKDAMQHLVANEAEFTASVREDMKHKLEAIAEDALAHGDRKSALAAYNQINQLEGLYVQKIDADVKEDTTISFQFGDDR